MIQCVGRTTEAMQVMNVHNTKKTPKPKTTHTFDASKTEAKKKADETMLLPQTNISTILLRLRMTCSSIPFY